MAAKQLNQIIYSSWRTKNQKLTIKFKIVLNHMPHESLFLGLMIRFQSFLLLLESSGIFSFFDLFTFSPFYIISFGKHPMNMLSILINSIRATKVLVITGNLIFQPIVNIKAEYEYIEDTSCIEMRQRLTNRPFLLPFAVF